MANKFIMFTEKSREKIMADFNDIANDPNALKKYPKSKFINATLGMYVKPKENTKKEKLYADIMNAHNKKLDPIVKEDSLVAWSNSAAEQFGLEIRDIIKMKPGQEMNLILIDRNVGEYIHKPIVGKKYDPKKDGFTYAKYIHEDRLKGILNMYEIGVIHSCFEWEINLADSKCFWGCIPKGQTVHDLNPKIKVGWRGPAIDMTDSKFLPKYFVHYGTWWNDYPGFRYYDFLDVDRIKKSNSQKGGSDDYYYKYIKYKSKYLELCGNHAE